MCLVDGGTRVIISQRKFKIHHHINVFMWNSKSIDIGISDDDATPGQSWLELFTGLPEEETNENTVKVKEEPPDREESFDRSHGNDSAQTPGSTDQERLGDANSSTRSGYSNDKESEGSYSWHQIHQPFGRPPYSSHRQNAISKPITLMDLRSAANIPTISSAGSTTRERQYPAITRTNAYSDFQCHLCNKILKDDKTYRRHMSAHRQPSDYPCTQCGRTFSLKMQLRRHNCTANVRHMQQGQSSPTMSPTHQYLSPPARPILPGPSSSGTPQYSGLAIQSAPSSSLLKMISCEECGRRFSRHQDLARHVCTKPNTTSAGQSSRQTSSISMATPEMMTLASLSQQNKNRQSADYPITCSGCGWSFSRRQDLRRHKCSGDFSKFLSQRDSQWSDGARSSKMPRSRSSSPDARHVKMIKYDEDEDSLDSSSVKSKKFEYMCAKCGSNFYTEDELQTHIDKCILEPSSSSENTVRRPKNDPDAPSPNANGELSQMDTETSAADDNQGSGTTSTSNTGLWRLVNTNNTALLSI